MSTQTELIAAPRNVCVFSECERYRYVLFHSWTMQFGRFVQVDSRDDEKRIMWIGLNPSTADVDNLDPTLRRIRSFTEQLGVHAFTMTNLFAYRATEPRDMLLQTDPVGEACDFFLKREAARAEMVIACWGTHGSHLGRDAAVRKLINAPMFCLGMNADGSPRHPLYVPGTQRPIPFSA